MIEFQVEFSDGSGYWEPQDNIEANSVEEAEEEAASNLEDWILDGSWGDGGFYVTAAAHLQWEENGENRSVGIYSNVLVSWV